MYFNPFVIQSSDGAKVPAKILPATGIDIAETHGSLCGKQIGIRPISRMMISRNTP